MRGRTRPNPARSILGWVSLSLLVGAFLGCGESGGPFAPVSGRVTLDGEPVANARVVFMPRATGTDGEAGPYSMGETDADGRYSLESVSKNPQEGAVVGPHRIIVSTRRAKLDPDNPDREIVESEERIPEAYLNHRHTPLRFEVTAAGSEKADFELSSKTRR